MITLGACMPFPPAELRPTVPVPAASRPTAPSIGTLYRPYGDDANLRGLGFLPNPPHYIRTVAGTRGWAPPPDGYHTDQYVPGNALPSYDNVLGWIPGDDAIATTRSCYLPVQAGWLNLERVSRTPAPAASLGEAASRTEPAAAPAETSRYQRYALMFSALSTFAIVANSAFAIYRNLRELRRAGT